MGKSESYIPYETTAKVIAVGEGENDTFLRSLFPEATDDQIYKFNHYIAGKIHDGIEYGMALSDYEPIGPMEAYKMGVEHGKLGGEV